MINLLVSETWISSYVITKLKHHEIVAVSDATDNDSDATIRIIENLLFFRIFINILLKIMN